MNHTNHKNHSSDKKVLTFLFLILNFSFLIDSFAQPAIYPDINGIVYVNKNITAGDSSGNSWDNAAPEFSNALLAAKTLNAITPCSIREIWVAEATYYPLYNAADNTTGDGGRDNAFVLQKDVQLYGGFPANANDANHAPNALLTIDQARNTRDWKNNPTILSGQRGSDPNIDTNNCYHVIFSVGDVGMACLDGFIITKGYANYANYDIKVNGYQMFSYNGGGIYNESSSPILRNLIIKNNFGIAAGGIGNLNSSPILTNVIIIDNIATAIGGIGNDKNSFPILTNVVVAKNIATLYSCGGISNVNIHAMTNVTICNNIAQGTCGGVYNVSHSSVRNSIIWGNRSNMDIGNNVENGTNATITYQNCLIGGEPIGNGIILNCDPLFKDAANGDYRLSYCSPAINVGNNAFYSPDSMPNLSAITTDLDGNPRIMNGIIDLGAYESKLASITFSGDSTSYRDTTVCYGDSVSIGFDLSGVAPWMLVYTKDKGINYDTVKNIMDSVFYWHENPLQTTTYNFVAIGDNNCVHTLRDSIQINVFPYPTVTSVLQNDTLCDGEQTKTVAFSGTANLYEWVTTGNISGIPTNSTGNFGTYIVNNKGNTPLTDYITITPKYTENGKICEGEDTNFSVTVLPEPTQITVLQDDTLCNGEQTKAIDFFGVATSYEWAATSDVSGIPTGTQIGNFGIYTVENTTANRTQSTITVTPRYTAGSKECAGTSQEFEIMVKPATIIHSITPNSLYLCEEDELRIEVNATGESLVYQWYQDGNILQGERNKDLIVSAVTQANSGKYYVEVSGVCGDTTSQTISIDASGSNILVEKWHDVIFVDNSSKQFIGYQWYKDGRIIDGATEQFYQEIGGLNGCYSVELRLKVGGKMRSCVRCAYKTSKEKGISVYPNPTDGQLIIDCRDALQCVCTGEYVIYSVVGQVVMEGAYPCGRPEITIDVSHLSAGMYFLKIGNKTVKFVKE